MKVLTDVKLVVENGKIILVKTFSEVTRTFGDSTVENIEVKQEVDLSEFDIRK
jgi:hypothetical protein